MNKYIARTFEPVICRHPGTNKKKISVHPPQHSRITELLLHGLTRMNQISSLISRIIMKELKENQTNHQIFLNNNKDEHLN